MSSATRYESDGGRNVIAATQGKLIADIARLGMTLRQRELNHLWSYYRTAHYDSRKVGWDGKEHADPIDHEGIAQAGFIPPGFYDAQHLPLKFRRPTAPYHLVKTIVDRFTGLLFSERRHPKIRCEADPKTEDFSRALAEASRVWQQMIQARAYGGATGTVAVGFQFVAGRPVVEVHDPRWLFPQFLDRSTLKLEAIEKRYMYPEEMQDPATGRWEQVWFWYRRIIDDNVDVLFDPALVEKDREPNWQVQREVRHGLGFCPVVWVQNLPVLDDPDGDPDCLGVYDMCDTIDTLLAQANRGVTANCDPTVVISSSAKLDEVAKGSNSAIKLPDGDAKYMEISGAGPKAALELADSLRAKVLEVAQCVLEHPDTAQKTATEIERVYSSMLAKADVMREQYGERCVKPLLQMMIRAARKLGTARRAEDGNIERSSLQLPPGKNGQPPQMGQTDGEALQLQWPSYFEPINQEILQSTQAAVAAKAAGLIDAEHASQFVAEYFRVEDVPTMLGNAKREQMRDQAELERMAMGSSQYFDRTAGEGEQK